MNRKIKYFIKIYSFAFIHDNTKILNKNLKKNLEKWFF